MNTYGMAKFNTFKLLFICTNVHGARRERTDETEKRSTSAILLAGTIGRCNRSLPYYSPKM